MPVSTCNAYKQIDVSGDGIRNSKVLVDDVSSNFPYLGKGIGDTLSTFFESASTTTFVRTLERSFTAFAALETSPETRLVKADVIKVLIRPPGSESRLFHVDCLTPYTIRTVQPMAFEGKSFEQGQSLLFSLIIESTTIPSKSAKVEIAISYVTSAGTGVIIGATADALMGHPMTILDCVTAAEEEL